MAKFYNEDGELVESGVPATKQAGAETAVKREPIEYVKGEPSIAETTSAYFQKHNWIGSLYSSHLKSNYGRFDSSFDPDTELLKHPDMIAYKDKLGHSRNADEFNSVLEQIKLDTRNNDVIDRTKGFIPNAVGFLAAAIPDPLNALPIAGPLLKAAKGASVVKNVVAGAATGAAIGAGQGLVQGAVIESSQTLTDPDTARDHAMYGAIGGALFGGIGNAWMASKLTKEIKDKAIADVKALITPPTSGNAGAMKVAPDMDGGMNLPGASDALLSGFNKIAGGAGKMEGSGGLSTPNVRLATSPLQEARRFGQELGNNAITTAENKAGVASAQSLELAIKQRQHVLEGQLLQSTTKEWKSFKAGYNKIDFAAMSDELKVIGVNLTPDELMNMKPSRKLFNGLAASAERNGYRSSISEIQSIAEASGKLKRSIADQANEQNLFENVHRQAERAAKNHAEKHSPIATEINMIKGNKTLAEIEQQAFNLIRYKDRLFEMKQSGKAKPANIARLEAAIARQEKRLYESDQGKEAVKKAHDEFGAVLKSKTADLTDVKIRREISKQLVNDRRTATSGHKALLAQKKQGLAGFVEQSMKDARAKSESLTPTTAETYFPRMPDLEEITIKEQAFKEMIKNFYVNERNVPDDEAILLADDIFNSITGKGSLSAGNNELVSATGFSALKSRTLDIPDNLLAPYLINDHEVVTRKYIHDMVRAVEFDRVFNGRSIDEVLDEAFTVPHAAARKEIYAKGLPKDEQDKLIGELENRVNSDRNAAVGIYNTVMGKPKVIDDFSSSSSALIKSWTNITTLGQILFASFTDPGRLVAIDGFRRPMQAAFAMIRSEFRKLSFEESEHIGYGMERMLGTSVNRLFDADTNTMKLRPTSFDKFIDLSQSKFHNITGFNYWNSSMKQLAGVMHADKVIKSVLDYDNLDDATKTYLAKAGIDKEMSARIAEQYAKYGVKEKSFNFGNTGLWDDDIAKSQYERAVFKLVNHQIMTPDAGTVPKFFKGQWGSVISQFTSFAYAGFEQGLGAGLGNPTKNEIKGFATMLALAGFVAWGRATQWGREESKKDIEELMFDTVDATGVFGPFGAVNSRLHQGGLGIQDLFDGQDEKMVDESDIFSSVAGPGFGKVISFMAGIYNVAHGSDSQKDLNRLVNEIPLNNHFLIKELGRQYKEANGDLPSRDLFVGMKNFVE